MTAHHPTHLPALTPSTRRFRVDKFAVPAHAVDEFVAQMKHLQSTLQAQPGCANAAVFTQLSGPGRFNVMTWVEWDDQASVDAAATVMQKRFASDGFDPKAFLQRLGVEADLGVYGEAA